jgi:hypothetical protein
VFKYVKFDHPRLGELRAVRTDNGKYHLVLEDLGRALGLTREEVLARLPHEGTMPIPADAVFRRVVLGPAAFKGDYWRNLDLMIRQAAGTGR